MITYTISNASYKKAEFDIQCLSTDQKPLGSIQGILIRNGSKLYEIDTGTKFMYDEQGGQWCEN